MTNQTQAPVPTLSADQLDRVIVKRSFLTLATVSPAGRPHVAGVVYVPVGESLWFHTNLTSRKARNLGANPHVGVVIPVRRIPVGAPPSTVQFQTTARIVAPDDPALETALASGDLADITSHGELDLPGGCFVRIELPKRMLTHGLGMSLYQLAKDPIGAAGVVHR